MKQILKPISGIILVTLLAACGVSTPAPRPTATFTPSPVPPSSTPILPPATITPTPTPLIPVSSAPDGLRMAYVMGVKGNLYFQDGSEPPLQLTNSGEDLHPLFFSEDGKKIFFFRRVIRQNLLSFDLYSIHVDGSQEQALVTNHLLLPFSADYNASTSSWDPVLVPHTQFLLFQTRSQQNEFAIVSVGDLFIVDTDSNQLKNLFSWGQGGSYEVSPDGSMIAIDRENYIDIIGIDGRMIRHKVATYTISEPIPLDPLVYWLSDSKELILALPINTHYDTAPPPLYGIWRYSLDTGTGKQINLDPPVMGNEATWVSLDGNWITYCNSNEGCFLGSLRDGHAEKLPGIGISSMWSPDSTHFVYDVMYQSDKPGLYLISVNDSPIWIGEGEFVRWLDASRYVYFTDGAYILGEIGKEPIPILAGNTWDLRSYANIIFQIQPASE